MQLGMVGLGRMGANIVRRIMRDGHTAVAFDTRADNAAQTELQLLGEVPNAIALHPPDAEKIDLMRLGFCRRFAEFRVPAPKYGRIRQLR